MPDRQLKFFIVIILVFFGLRYQSNTLAKIIAKNEHDSAPSYRNYERLLSQFAGRIPSQWSETVDGVKTKFITNQKEIAITMDLCGSLTDGCDHRYLDFFELEQIPVTIFVTSKWIKKYPYDFAKLCENKLFDIENHGLLHRPCSVTGKSIYGITGTQNITDVIEEVENNAQIIEQYTDKKPHFYRSGTAYYDEIAVEIVNALGYQVLGFNINGDYGATASKERVKSNLLKAQPGDIIILHLNRPEKPCAEGAIEAFKELKLNGFTFVKLRKYQLI